MLAASHGDRIARRTRFVGPEALIWERSASTRDSLLTVGENDQGSLFNMIANDGVTVLCQAQDRPGLVFFFTGGTSA